MMNKLHLTKVKLGNYSKEKPLYERLMTLNNGIAERTNTSITVKMKDGKTFTSILQKINESFITEEFKGSFADGIPFRLVIPSATTRMRMALDGKRDSITFGDLTGDGYSVHFDLAKIDEPDTKILEENSNTIFVSEIESKAEKLVMTTNYLQSTDTKMAREHINRFINLLAQNEIEFVKFEQIQNIINGYILAIGLSAIDEETAIRNLNDIKLRYHSRDHLRYENGIHVSGPHGGAGRGIEIIPNFDTNQGYLVTIYNQDGVHPVWGNNIQMATKQMKVISKTANEIKLRGFGTDSIGNSFSDYALSIHISGYDIEYIKLQLLDRGVEIKYLK